MSTPKLEKQLQKAFELQNLIDWTNSEGVQVAQYGSWFGAYIGEQRPPGEEGCLSFEQSFVAALRAAKANVSIENSRS